MFYVPHEWGIGYLAFKNSLWKGIALILPVSSKLWENNLL